MLARRDLAVMSGESGGAIGLGTAGLGAVCRGIARWAVSRNRWRGLTLDSQRSW